MVLSGREAFEVFSELHLARPHKEAWEELTEKQKEWWNKMRWEKSDPCEKSKIPKPKAAKPPVHQGVLDMFPNALLEIAKASQFGAEKYGWENWGKIPTQEYKDALGRHLLEKGVNEESGLLHLTHVAWNALAVLELTMQENKVDNPDNS